MGVAPCAQDVDGKAHSYTSSTYFCILAILPGALLAGILDGTDAVVTVWMRSIPIARLFQYIASGLLGVQAFQGGWPVAALGVLLHFVVAAGAAATYHLFSLKLPLLIRRPAISGPIFGVGVYLFMHYLVLPLSSAPPQPSTRLQVVNQLLSHTLFVGLPIALTRSWADHSCLCRRDSAAADSACS